MGPQYILMSLRWISRFHTACFIFTPSTIIVGAFSSSSAAQKGAVLSTSFCPGSTLAVILFEFCVIRGNCIAQQLSQALVSRVVFKLFGHVLYLSP